MKKVTKKITVAELAGIVSEQLKSDGLQCVLVGGAVVTIYSRNEYESKDLDFIGPNDQRQLTAWIKHSW